MKPNWKDSIGKLPITSTFSMLFLMTIATNAHKVAPFVLQMRKLTDRLDVVDFIRRTNEPLTVADFAQRISRPFLF